MTANFEVKIDDKLLKNFEKTVRKLPTHQLRVGFFDGKEEESKDGEKEPITIAAIARLNEFGDKKKRIPERPFMQQNLEAHGFYKRHLAIRLGKVIRNKSSISTQLNRLGEIMVSDTKITTTSGDFEENKKSTIAKKGSDKPLIDLGNMRANVSYRVG
ncbi:hypothetical protein [Piscirickettsia litoralis]|uniref:Uncharacterized protein n=1 Tax=Piscirickettsia litoralis TaxID=1891921 RepID=A0ABX2ZXZ2_9GAMM|nr:hypothetical protein [Piscirickettsia litoralis]ODN41070.1 hypothetical protein BGC07_18150 [Piscirickettsia litoralis]